MKRRFNQAGFAAWELLLVVVVLAGIAVAGYHVYNSNKTTSSSTASSSQTSNSNGSAVTTPGAPAVSNTADLNKATAALNQVDPSGGNSSDSSQLSSQNSF